MVSRIKEVHICFVRVLYKTCKEENNYQLPAISLPVPDKRVAAITTALPNATIICTVLKKAVDSSSKCNFHKWKSDLQGLKNYAQIYAHKGE